MVNALVVKLTKGHPDRRRPVTCHARPRSVVKGLFWVLPSLQMIRKFCCECWCCFESLPLSLGEGLNVSPQCLLSLVVSRPYIISTAKGCEIHIWTHFAISHRGQPCSHSASTLVLCPRPLPAPLASLGSPLPLLPLGLSSFARASRGGKSVMAASSLCHVFNCDVFIKR